jgi:putative ABC transport system permease protein
MSRLSLALRIARRTSSRSTSRSALIIAMIALPVTGMAAVALVGSSLTPTTAEKISTKLGETQALVQVIGQKGDGIRQVPTRPSEYDIVPRDEMGVGLPSGKELFDGLDYRYIPVYATTIASTTETGIATFDAVEGAVWDPSFAGRFDLLEGRGPVTDNEVMVSPATLDRLGIAVGGTVTLRATTTRPVTVVGTIDDQSRADSAQIFFGRTGAFASRAASDRAGTTIYYIPREVIDWNDVLELNARGAVVLSRNVLLNPPPPSPEIRTAVMDDTPLSIFAIAGMLGLFAAFEVVLLAGAAFTVTARQQQRTLATIASVGATTSTLRSVVTASGLVLGAIGGVLGVGLGILAGAVFMALTADGSRVQYYGFHLPWLLLIAVAVFAVLVGWIAALAPARVAARLDVVAALRGSRRPPEPSARRPVVGLVLLVVGIGLTLVGGILMSVGLPADEYVFASDGALKWVPGTLLAIGPVLALVGLIACGPLVLRVISRLLQGNGLGARLASRDAARNPGRSVPAIAVTMTTIFIAVVGMNLLASIEKTQAANWQYTIPEGEIIVGLDNRYDYSGADAPLMEYDPETLEKVIRTSVDVDELAVVSTVREPLDIVGGENPVLPQGVDYPYVEIPTENACVEPYDANDWRCQTWFIDPGSSGIRDRIMVGDAAGLALALGRAPSAAALAALDTGGVVSLYRHPVVDNTITISWWTGEQLVAGDHYNGGAPVRSVTAPAVVDEPEHAYYLGVFMSPSTAIELGLEAHPAFILASVTSPPTDAQADALMFSAELAKPGMDRNGSPATISEGPEPYAAAWTWGLLGLAGLIALASASVAIGLARFDGRRDDATLASLGSSRLVRRNFAFWQAIVLTGTGALLGASLGLIPSIALSQNTLTPFAPPWLPITLIVVALPLVIGAGSWLVAARAPWVMRVAGE